MAAACLAPVGCWASQQNVAAGFYQAPDLQNKKPEESAPPPVNKEEPPPASGDACAATISENDGIVNLALHDPVRAGKATIVSVDDFDGDPQLDYDARFDGDGDLTVTAPIFHEDAPVRWEGVGGATCRQTVRFAGFAHAFRAALIWTGPVILALHVVEPTGAIGSARHYVSPAHPNLALAPGSYGLMREFGKGGSKLHVQLYSVPSGQNPRDKSPVSFHVEFFSRGNPTAAPFCGDNPLARVGYQAIFQQDGQPPKRMRGGFAPLACGFSWSETERSFSRLSDMRM
jgi:hypothetical protein